MKLLCLLLSFAFFTILSTLENKRVKAYLIYVDSNKADTVESYERSYTDSQKIDLLYCIKNFEYPRNLPKNLILTVKPGHSITFNQKCIYDENGKLIKYFYRGSLVSGIIPLGYDFIYESENSFKIKYIKDDYDESIYELKYQENGNLFEMTLSDTTGIRHKLLLNYP